MNAEDHIVDEQTRLPFVTVQLPIYNERFVAARLIDASAKLRWPRERLEIQILDDSDDDTVDIVDRCAEYWSGRRINMKVLRRNHRKGYKAGALNYGLKLCSGQYIAIFDADFVPPPEFLQKTIPWFSDKNIGMVQARWDFLNRDQSWLTKVQAILLGAHFRIEHWVRFKRKLFFNFNGTAGIWRKEAMESAGGWEDDTVTEDLDLSYRAQLAGWKFMYLDELSVFSELPSTIQSFRSQQQRWAKGSIQTARKILPRLMREKIPPRVKIEAGFHLLSNLGWLFGMVITVTLFPAILMRTHIGPHQILRIDLPLFLGASCSVLFFFFVSLYKQSEHKFLPYLMMLPVFSIGIASSIAVSVVGGLFLRGGIFERTPKFGIGDSHRRPYAAFFYRERKLSYMICTIVLFLYSLMPLFYACKRSTWPALPFLMLFPIGLLVVVVKEASEMWSTSPAKKRGESA